MNGLNFTDPGRLERYILSGMLVHLLISNKIPRLKSK